MAISPFIIQINLEWFLKFSVIVNNLTFSSKQRDHARGRGVSCVFNGNNNFVLFGFLYTIFPYVGFSCVWYMLDGVG